MKFTSLLANLLIFHNTLDIADVVRQLQAEGEVIDPLDLAQISPYLTEHVNRFGVSGVMSNSAPCPCAWHPAGVPVLDGGFGPAG